LRDCSREMPGSTGGGVTVFSAWSFERRSRSFLRRLTSSYSLMPKCTTLLILRVRMLTLTDGMTRCLSSAYFTNELPVMLSLPGQNFGLGLRLKDLASASKLWPRLRPRSHCLIM